MGLTVINKIYHRMPYFVEDFKGVLLIDFLHTCRTVNAAYFCDLLEQVRAAYRSKRRGFPIRDVLLLLHDNARPHSAALTQEKLAQMYWTALEQPAIQPGPLSLQLPHVWTP